MLDPHLYVLFLTAALALTLSPGADTMFVLGASLGGGTRGACRPRQESSPACSRT
jgi:threonine/homoserine/homoserine lactone efflux protein